MPGKRAYHLQVQKKNADQRKQRAAGLEWFVIDQSAGEVERAPRGHVKARREPAMRKRRPPSGRGISEDGTIFMTGGKPTAGGQISSSRPKPRRTRALKRHPTRRHRDLKK